MLPCDRQGTIEDLPCALVAPQATGSIKAPLLYGYELVCAGLLQITSHSSWIAGLPWRMVVLNLHAMQAVVTSLQLPPYSNDGDFPLIQLCQNPDSLIDLSIDNERHPSICPQSFKGSDQLHVVWLGLVQLMPQLVNHVWAHRGHISLLNK